MKKGILLVCAFLLFFSGKALGVEETPAAPSQITFREFCRKVLAYYPKLKQEGATVEMAISRKLQAVANFLPRINGFTSMTTSNDQVYVFGTLLRQRGFKQDDFSLARLNNPASRTNYDIGVRGEMPLFDSMQTIYKVKQAKHMLESSRYDEIFSTMEALLIASDAYFHTLAVESLLNIIDETCKNSEVDIKQAEELKDKGMVLGADFYAAKVVLGSLKNMKNDLAGQREALYALLNILMGESPLKPLQLADTIKEVRQDNKLLKDWLADAYEYRADLHSVEQLIEAQKADVSREKARMLPNISAFGDLRENTQDFNTGGGSFAVGIKGSIDVFDPEYFLRIKLARAALQKLEYQKDVVKDSISRDVIDGYMRLRSIHENVPLLYRMTEDANQAVNLTLPLYREGRKSIADLLEMRRAYVGTYQSYYFTMTDSKVSWARLLFLSGQLDESKVEQALHTGE